MDFLHMGQIISAIDAVNSFLIFKKFLGGSALVPEFHSIDCMISTIRVVWAIKIVEMDEWEIAKTYIE